MAAQGMSEEDAQRLQSLLNAEDDEAEDDEELDYLAPTPAPDATSPAPAATPALGATPASEPAAPEPTTSPSPAPTLAPEHPSESQVDADAALARSLATAEEGDEALARALQASLDDAPAPAPAPPQYTPPPAPLPNTTCFVAVVGFDHAKGNVLEWAFPGAEAAWSESLPFAALPDGAHHVAAGKGEVCRFSVRREDNQRLYGCSCVMQASPSDLTGRAATSATRSKVQKAICVLHTNSRVAWSARLGPRVEACAAALFAGGNLDDRILLMDFHASLKTMSPGEPSTNLFDACARLGFAGALRCLKALVLGQSLVFVHAKSVCAAPDAALAFADVLHVFDEDSDNGDAVAAFGRCLKPQVRLEPSVALGDLDRVASLGDEFQLIAGTANAHLAEAGLGPRLSPACVARLEADAPKATRVKAFGPSQYASSAVCRLTPVEEALAAALDERAAKVFQRGDGEGFRDDDQWAKHALRAHLRDVLDRLAATPLVPDAEGHLVGDREFAGDLARRHGGPFVAAFLDTAPAVRFLAQRNPALADWLSVADAPTLARSFDPSLADRIGFARLHVRKATKDLTVDDALASGQKALTNVAAELTNVGSKLSERFPRTAGAFRGGDAGAAAAAGVGPDLAPDSSTAATAFAQPSASAPPPPPPAAEPSAAGRVASLWRDRLSVITVKTQTAVQDIAASDGVKGFFRRGSSPRTPASPSAAGGGEGSPAGGGEGSPSTTGGGESSAEV